MEYFWLRNKIEEAEVEKFNIYRLYGFLDV
jgi:hypothetical protein